MVEVGNPISHMMKRVHQQRPIRLNRQIWSGWIDRDRQQVGEVAFLGLGGQVVDHLWLGIGGNDFHLWIGGGDT